MKDIVANRYQIKEELGQGGMATVFRAYDRIFQRDIALKLLSIKYVTNSNVNSRFEREAQIVASLEHPAIVPVYDFGYWEERPYLVMRLMSGGTLMEQMAQGPFSLKTAVNVLERLVHALDYAHFRGVIHRDLKPQNILLDQWGKTYLSDFGIVKLIDQESTLTDTGVVIGTPAYMSPEQVQGEEIDYRSDIYSLGVNLFEMLSGVQPFKARTPIAIGLMHVNKRVPDISTINNLVPIACQQIIEKAMAKEPSQRFISANEMFLSLSDLAQKEVGPSVEDVAVGEEQVAQGTVENTDFSDIANNADPIASMLDQFEKTSVGTEIEGQREDAALVKKQINVLPIVLVGLFIIVLLIIVALRSNIFNEPPDENKFVPTTTNYEEPEGFFSEQISPTMPIKLTLPTPETQTILETVPFVPTASAEPADFSIGLIERRSACRLATEIMVLIIEENLSQTVELIAFDTVKQLYDSLISVDEEIDFTLCMVDPVDRQFITSYVAQIGGNYRDDDSGRWVILANQAIVIPLEERSPCVYRLLERLSFDDLDAADAGSWVENHQEEVDIWLACD